MLLDDEPLDGVLLDVESDEEPFEDPEPSDELESFDESDPDDSDDELDVDEPSESEVVDGFAVEDEPRESLR